MNTRQAEKKDFHAVKTVWEQAFNYSRSFMDWYFEQAYRPQNTMVVTEGDAVIASANLLPQQIVVRNKPVQAAYITAIGALPEWRSQELERKLACDVTQIAAERGELVSLLIPYNYKFYERYGWRTAYNYKQYTITAADIPAYQIRGRIVRCGKNADAIAALQSVYGQFAHGLNAYTVRGDAAWKLILDDLFTNFGGTCALLQDEAGQAVGYLLYIIHDGRMGVYEFAYTNRAAYESLLGYIKAHDMQVGTVTMKVPENDLTYLDFCDSRNAVSICPFAMARVNDVQKMLELLAEGFAGQFRLQIIDRLMEGNNRTFAVDGQAVSAVDGTADVVTDIGTFTQLALGYISPEEAVRMNMLSGKAELVDAFFQKGVNYINMLCY